MTSGIFHPPLNASIIVPAGGSAPYAADAVHWDGTSYLGNATLSCGSHNKISLALWFKAPFGTGVAGFWITDPDEFNFTYVEGDMWNSPGDHGGMNFSFIDVNNTTYLATANSRTDVDPPAIGIWYCYMASADCSTNLGAVLSFLDDANISDEGHGTTNEGSPGAVIQGNGSPMHIGIADAGGNDPFDMANLLVWYGTAIDWTVEANRRKVIDADGKPVDPAEAVLAFGMPTVMMTGDATAFQTNQGSGGSFSLTGSLTNASTSPSD